MSIREPRLKLVDMPPERADAVLGKKRKHYCTPIEQRVRQLAICEAYPTWDMYHEQIAVERMEAYLQSRQPHKATQPPPPRHPAADPQFPGPSAADIRQRYDTKDPI